MKVAGAVSVETYLANLPPDRRDVVATMRDVVNAHIPSGYEEMFAYDMITWAVPLSRFPNTYNGQPICYVALASQKHHFSLYLTCVYGDDQRAAEFRAGFARDGKKLDMGKSCVRFQRIEQLSLPTIEQAIAGVPPETMMAMHDASHNPEAKARRSAARAKAKAGAKAKPKPEAKAKPRAKAKAKPATGRRAVRAAARRRGRSGRARR